jgi:serine protease inhibitor
MRGGGAAVELAERSPDARPVRVDRPFLFFIRDGRGLVLFRGQVVDVARGPGA